MADLTSGQMKGLAYGVYYFVNGVALLPGGIIAGLLWDIEIIGQSLTFIWGGSMVLIGVPILLIVCNLPRILSNGDSVQNVY